MKWVKALAAIAVFIAAPIVGNAAGVGGVNPALLAACTQTAIYDASSSGATKLVSGNATQQIYVCGFDILATTGSVNVDLIYGTGGTCGTGTTKITPAFQMTTTTPTIVDHLQVYTGLPPAPVNNDVCINASAGVAVEAIVYYTQF